MVHFSYLATALTIFLITGVFAEAKLEKPFSSPAHEQLKKPLKSSGKSEAWGVAIVEGLKNAAASGIASAVVKASLQPFDTIKTVQQFSTSPMSPMEATRLILKRSGWLGLYSGVLVTIFGAVPSVATYFGSYQYFRKIFESWDWNPSFGIVIAAGIGNSLASGLRVPYETVKQKLQAGIYPDTLTALRSMHRENGIRAFFCKGGVGIQLIRDVPYAMVTLLVYEKLQIYFRNKIDKKYHGWMNIFIGGFAGGVGTWVTNPMDVVKTRVMLLPSEQYKGLSFIVSDIWVNEGACTFFKGAVPRLLHRVPANAVFFVVYEFFRTLFKIQR